MLRLAVQLAVRDEIGAQHARTVREDVNDAVLLPLALGLEPDGGSRASLAIVVIGGLTSIADAHAVHRSRSCIDGSRPSTYRRKDLLGRTEGAAAPGGLGARLAGRNFGFLV
jgi:hypothetical protein